MRQERLWLDDITLSAENNASLSHINFNLFQGEAAALMDIGGSATQLLFEMLSGDRQPECGRICIDEQEMVLQDAVAARRQGVYRISHQRALIGELTIAENIFLIRSNSLKKLFIKRGLLHTQTKRLLEQIGLILPPFTPVNKLSLAQCHLVELAKAVSSGAKLVLLDEIISSYSIEELATFQAVIVKLKKERVSFLICCNSLDRVRLLCEKTFFFREGTISKKIKTEQLKQEDIAEYLLGYIAERKGKSKRSASTEVVLEVRSLWMEGLGRPLDFSVCGGEVLALLGFNKVCQRELLRILAGEKPQEAFHILVSGVPLERNLGFGAGKVAIIRNIGREGDLFDNMSVEENLLFPSLKKVSGLLGFVDGGITKLLAKEYPELSHINMNSEADRNTRIVVQLERWYIYHPKVLVLVEPFLFCDMIGEQIVRDFINRVAAYGSAVILLGQETQKMTDECDRILHM